MSLLTAEEKMYFIPLTIIILLVFIEAVLSKNKLKIFSPIVFIAAVYAFYTVVSPFVMLQVEEEILFGAVDRSFYKSAWIGSLVSFLFILLGYYFPPIKHRMPKKQQHINLNKLFLYGFFLNLAGFIFYASLNPAKAIGQLNPFSVSELQLSGIDYEGSIRNYLKNGVNFLITGNTLILLSIKRFSIFNLKTQAFIFWFLIAAALYTSLGFRFRIALLVGSLTICYFIKQQKRPSFTLVAVIAPLFVVVMGIIGATRSYSSGLNLNVLEGSSSTELLLKGMMEANIFLISGAVLNSAPDKMDFVGFDPIKQTILFPIPKSIYPAKNSSRYLRKAIAVHPSLKRIDAQNWAAFMFFADWYIAFGWTGLALISLFMGLAYKNLYRWTMRNYWNYYVVSIYGVAIAYSYIFISRGYLPQAALAFSFVVMPAVIVYVMRSINWKIPSSKTEVKHKMRLKKMLLLVLSSIFLLSCSVGNNNSSSISTKEYEALEPRQEMSEYDLNKILKSIQDTSISSEIVLTEGIYNINTSIVLSKELSLIGEGEVIIKTSSNESLRSFLLAKFDTNSIFFSAKNIKFKGNRKKVLNCITIRSRSDIRNLNFVKFNNCSFSNFGYAILTETPTQLEVKNCRFELLSHAINSSSCQNCIVKNNQFKNLTDALVFLNRKETPCQMVLLENNTIQKITNYCIGFINQHQKSHQNITIAYNKILNDTLSYENYLTGGSADQISIHGAKNVLIKQNISTGGGDMGVTLNRVSDTKVISNYLAYNQRSGIVMLNKCQDIEIKGNLIMNNGQSKKGREPDCGIFFSKNQHPIKDDILIVDNIIFDNQKVVTQIKMANFRDKESSFELKNNFNSLRKAKRSILMKIPQ